LKQLQDGVALKFISVDWMGEDLRIVARVQGRDTFLQSPDI
jgi:diaminohydroxyphosphoribosylaminopyrimidine deaminase / 5-amino-6-(5-phosphoribosylamino)uracil reductase